MSKIQTHKKIQRAFTLIELLIVIAIIALLASIVMVAVNNARSKSHVAAAIQNVGQVSKGLELYYQENGSYPYPTAVFSSTDPVSYSKLQGALTGFVSLPPDDSGQRIHYAYYGPYQTIPGSWIQNPQPCIILYEGFVMDVGMPQNSYTLNDGGIFTDGYEVYGGNYKRGIYSGGSCQ